MAESVPLEADVPLREAFAAYVRARDWDDPVRIAWQIAERARVAADVSSVNLEASERRLAQARADVSQVQKLPPPNHGEGADRSRQWHRASASLREAVVEYAALQAIANECARVARVRIMEFVHVRDTSPYVAALWREYVKVGGCDPMADFVRKPPTD